MCTQYLIKYNSINIDFDLSATSTVAYRFYSHLARFCIKTSIKGMIDAGNTTENGTREIRKYSFAIQPISIYFDDYTGL